MADTKMIGALTFALVVVAFLAMPVLFKNREPRVEPLNQGVREIRVEAFRYGFSPDPIKVKQGERIRLVGTSRDVAHSLVIPELGVNLLLEPGKESSVEFTANKKGTFTMFCGVYCGGGHGSMRGTVVVE